MRLSRRTIAGAAVLFLAALPATLSRAAEPAASASGSTASASVSGSASAHVDQRKKFSDELPPDEKSTVPTANEWKSAIEFRFDRGLESGCTATRVREWVRVTCRDIGAAVGLVAGTAEGFSGAVPIPGPGIADGAMTHWVQFPVRRGDRRLVQIRHAGRGNYDNTLYASSTASFLSIQWLPGELPFLIAQGS